MISQVLDDRVGFVQAALEQSSRQLEPVGNGKWCFRPREEGLRSVTATLEGVWLALVARPLPELLTDAPPWDLLQRNARLPGLAKFALMPDRSLQLRAELQVFEDMDLGARICEVCAGFQSACSLYEFSGTDTSHASAFEKADLKRLCAETGWPFIERGPDKLLIELEVANHFRQAALIPAGRGIHVSCELVTCDSLLEPSQHAIASLLLSASGVLRLVRGSLAEDSAGLEATFVAPPCPSEISSALESLSVGCSLCGEEVKTLRDPAVARRFLELRGWNVSAPARTKGQTQ